MILRLSMEVENYFSYHRYIAIDWAGKQIDHPLLRFCDENHLSYSNAGEQGPRYFWVEQDGKRGYINEQGEWLFVDGE